MLNCTKKSIFFSVSKLTDIVTGSDPYVYPFNQENIKKFKGHYINAVDLKHTYKLHPEECKYIKSNDKDDVKLKTFIDNIKDDYIELVSKDKKMFDIIEKLIIDNHNINTDKDSHNYELGIFYADLCRSTKKFSDIPIDKLRKRNSFNNMYLLDAIDKHCLTIDDIDKYVPKDLIPTKENFHTFNCKNEYDIYRLALIDPRFAKYVLDFNLIWSNNNKFHILHDIHRKHWKQLINSGFSYKYNSADYSRVLNENPCHIIFYPIEFHTEEKYMKAVEKDLECFHYLNKKIITSKVIDFYNSNVKN